jgi:hypothetical protein
VSVTDTRQDALAALWHELALAREWAESYPEYRRQVADLEGGVRRQADALERASFAPRCGFCEHTSLVHCVEPGDECGVLDCDCTQFEELATS